MPSLLAAVCGESATDMYRGDQYALQTEVERELERGTALLAQELDDGVSVAERQSVFVGLHSLLETSLKRLSQPGTEAALVCTVALLQRVWLYHDALLEFMTHLQHHYTFDDPHPPQRRSHGGIRTDLMGAFARTSEYAARLYAMGIPVWLVRRPGDMDGDIVQAVVPSPLRVLPNRHGIFTPTVLYEGPEGEELDSAIISFGAQYMPEVEMPPPGDPPPRECAVLHTAGRL